MFHARVKTGAALVIAVCLILGFSHLPPVLYAAIAFLTVCAVWEMSKAFDSGFPGVAVGAAALELVLLLLLPDALLSTIVSWVFLAMLIIFLCAMGRFGSLKSIPQWFRLLILFALPLFYAAMQPVRAHSGGVWLLAIAIFLCMITDSFAFLVGKRFGKHKLAPRISPHKSIEGSIGGTVSAAVLILAAVGLVRLFRDFQVNWGLLALYLVTGSVISQLGDLSMSVIKRVEGIKDYGKLLPGHGGILDRFDSLLFVLPYTCLFLDWAGPIF